MADEKVIQLTDYRCPKCGQHHMKHIACENQAPPLGVNVVEKVPGGDRFGSKKK